jgi:hypothetical protein
VHRSEEQRFDSPAARNTAAEQTGRKDFRVVEDQKVARLEVLRKRGKLGVFGRARCGVEDEEARSTSNSGRLLSNELIRQFEVEIRDVHLINILGSALAAD